MDVRYHSDMRIKRAVLSLRCTESSSDVAGTRSGSVFRAQRRKGVLALFLSLLPHCAMPPFTIMAARPPHRCSLWSLIKGKKVVLAPKNEDLEATNVTLRAEIEELKGAVTSTDSFCTHMHLEVDVLQKVSISAPLSRADSRLTPLLAGCGELARA